MALSSTPQAGSWIPSATWHHGSVDDHRAIKAAVGGIVQGVGFRYSTRQAAQRLDVVGWVRNMPDASVEVLAQGSRAAIDRMIDFLKVGPPHCLVSSVEITETTVDPALTRFEVRS